jgi:putative toxin-antitoxin system antitoxin component (TIGR02293 family)
MRSSAKRKSVARTSNPAIAQNAAGGQLAVNRSGKALPLRDIVDRELKNAAAGKGANTGILSELAAHGFARDELFDLVIPRRTFARRLQTNEPLSPEESDRAVRLARLAAMAERVFGDGAKAHRWLRKPSRTLAGAIPLILIKSETGAHLVEQTLHRIQHGMLA